MELLHDDQFYAVTKMLWYGWICPTSPICIIPRDVIRYIIHYLQDIRTPDVFTEEDNDTNTKYDPHSKKEPRLVAATLPKLIEKITLDHITGIRRIHVLT